MKLQARRSGVWDAVGVLSLAFWALSAIQLRRARRIRWLGEYPPADQCPSLSVIVPACNEAATVEPAMLSLLALDYPNLTIVAVDDRSTDDTGAILDRMAATDPRLKVLHLTELPSGWLGKNHALWMGSREAAGELLLFTDADVLFAPDALRRAARLVQDLKVDHLTLAPGVLLHGFWERLLVSHFVVLFSLHIRPWEVEDPTSKAYVGIGAFNLVRRDAYEAVNGHAALPMEVADDTKLGKVLKRSGKRQVCGYGSDLVRVRWVIGARGFVEGLTKNMFAGLEYRWQSVLGVSALLAFTHILPVPALVRGGRTARLASAGCFGMMALCALPPAAPPGFKQDPELTPGPLYGFAFPLAGILYIYTIWRSAVLAEWRGGIEWRGTLYPLDELRRNVV